MSYNVTVLILLNHFDQVINDLDHAARRRSVLMFHDRVDLVETERFEGETLVLGDFDLRAGEFYFNFCHDLDSLKKLLLTLEHLLYADAAVLRYGISVTHLTKRGDGGLHQVVRVARTLRLSEHVSDTHRLEHRTHGTTGLYSRTRGGWLQKYLSSSITSLLLVRHRSVEDWHANEIFLCVLGTLGDGGLNFASLSKTATYYAIPVAHNDDGAKGKRTTSLGDLGNAVHRYHTLVEFEVIGRSYFIVCFHS